MSKLMLDVDQAGELKAAFRRGNWTNEDLKKLCEGDLLKRLRYVLLNRAKINIHEHIVDGDVDPYIPKGWKIKHHKKQGEMKVTRAGDDLLVNGVKVELYITGRQQDEEKVPVADVYKKVTSKPVLNANLLDYLHENPELIPDSWKNIAQRHKTADIHFFGTVYCDGYGFQHVRHLFCYENRWGIGDRTIDAPDGYFSIDDPAAVLAS